MELLHRAECSTWPRSASPTGTSSECRTSGPTRSTAMAVPPGGWIRRRKPRSPAGRRPEQPAARRPGDQCAGSHAGPAPATTTPATGTPAASAGRPRRPPRRDRGQSPFIYAGARGGRGDRRLPAGPAPAQGLVARMDARRHARLHRRRLLLIIPTLFGIMVLNFVIVQFAPGGPVEQTIAELKGTGHFGDRAHCRQPIRRRQQGARSEQQEQRLSRRARAGPRHHQGNRAHVRLRQAGP